MDYNDFNGYKYDIVKKAKAHMHKRKKEENTSKIVEYKKTVEGLIKKGDNSDN